MVILHVEVVAVVILYEICWLPVMRRINIKSAVPYVN
jgi:hypothetical protein